MALLGLLLEEERAALGMETIGPSVIVDDPVENDFGRPLKRRPTFSIATPNVGACIAISTRIVLIRARGLAIDFTEVAND